MRSLATAFVLLVALVRWLQRVLDSNDADAAHGAAAPGVAA